MICDMIKDSKFYTLLINKCVVPPNSAKSTEQSKDFPWNLNGSGLIEKWNAYYRVHLVHQLRSNACYKVNCAQEDTFEKKKKKC
jgi:hypothetical protein